MLLTSNIDLKGQTMTIPENTILVGRGGIIKNGTVVGNNTTIETNKAVFSDVSIKGTWMLPEISTSLFANLKRVNSLKDVLALANPSIKNTIVIGEGAYTVEAKHEKEACLTVCSNTEMVLNGSITLMPNNFLMCDVIRLEGENIILKGKGQIVGDKFTHTGSEGEWGMGIRISNAKNVTVSGLTIKNCWGDCIYINKQSKNVVIDGCYLDHGRRQGISVICADGVTIRRCVITNVGGTNPQYGIDIEPNAKDYVDHVKIDHVTIEKCKGGITTLGRTKNGKPIQIGSVHITDCDISSTKRIPVRLRAAKKATVRNCRIYSPRDLNAVLADGVDNIQLEGNHIAFDNSLTASAKRFLKSIKAGEEILPIKISNCMKQSIKNNQIKK
jgi:parallel beta-helix repeat protein